MSALTPKYTDLIFDVGMHKGEDTNFYLKKGFRVVAFEADPACIEHCRRHFATAITAGILTIVDGAIVNAGELNSGKPTASFYRNLDQPEWGTVHEGRAAQNAMLGTRNEVIEVKTVDFAACLRRYGMPYYMKIDIEGSDRNCLEALLGFAASPDYLSVEAEKEAFPKLQEEIALLELLGYSMFKPVKQSTVSQQMQPHPPMEGDYAPDHSFPPGSSGLFGKELPGAWQSADEVLARYNKILSVYRLFGEHSVFQRSRIARAASRSLTKRVLRRPGLVGWYDTHARHSRVSGES